MVKKETITTDDLLQRIDTFSSLLLPEQLDELTSCISVKRYAKNQVIYTEGDVPQFMYCLLSGKAKITKSGVEGRMQIVRVLRPVEYFGYRAYFANENYVTAGTAFESSLVCSIPIEMIERWMQNNIQLALFFVHHLSIYLGDSDRRAISLTQKHLRGRLAEALLFLHDRYGFEDDGITLSIYISREDLASLSNMTSSNAIRTLSAFASEGILDVDGRKIRVIDLEKLKNVSRIG